MPNKAPPVIRMREMCGEKVAGGDMPTFGEFRAARLAGREVELSPEQRAQGEKLAKALEPLVKRFEQRAQGEKLAKACASVAKFVAQHQQTLETVERLPPRQRRVFLDLTLSEGARLLRGRPHGHAPRNTSRLNNGRTRRPTRRASSARRTRSGARSAPSDLSDNAEPADGPALQLDLDTFAYGRAS